MGKKSEIFEGLKPAMGMVVVQATFAGMNLFYKVAATDGMSLRIITAYRFLFAVPVMVPLALLVERERPKLNWTILFQAFLCGLFGGSLSQNLYIESLALTSATFSSAMANLLPATTFIFSLVLGIEKLALRTTAGKAKVLGTLVGVSGAMVLTFYEGVQINIWPKHYNLLPHKGHRDQSNSSSHNPNAPLGALLAFGCCICYTLWLIIQAKMSKKYPCPYSSTALMCIMGAIQSIAFALCTEREWSKWKLGWNIRLLTVAYAGIVVSGLTCTMMTWCIRVKGPLYTSVFNPLMLVMVALGESLLLGAKLYLGSVLGALLIVMGLYFVLWGKGKEMKKMMSDKVAAKTNDDEAVEINVDTTNHDNNRDNNIVQSAKVSTNEEGSKDEGHESDRDKGRQIQDV